MSRSVLEVLEAEYALAYRARHRAERELILSEHMLARCLNALNIELIRKEKSQ